MWRGGEWVMGDYLALGLFLLNQFFLEPETYNFIILYLLDNKFNTFKLELFDFDYFIETIIYILS